MKKYYVLGLILPILMFVNLQFLDWHFLSASLFLIFLWLLGKICLKILNIGFNFKLNLSSNLLGIFFGLVIISLFLSALLFFYGFNNLSVLISLVLSLIFVIVLLSITKNSKNKRPKLQVDFLKDIVLPIPKFLVFVYLGLAGYGFYLLYISKTSDLILSPWQTIVPSYIYVFFATALLLGFLILSKIKYKTALLLLVIFSFLTHFYLPLTHQFFYGADGWRHLATENQILQSNEIISPNLADNPQLLVNKFDIGKLAYTQFWSFSLLLNKIFNFDLSLILIWLVPILSSLMLPLILFEIAQSLRWGKRESLLFVWFSFLPFALQITGAISLPNTLGFLFFIFSFLLVLKYLKSDKNLNVLLLLGCLMLFSYSLYFILYWLFLGLVIIHKLLGKKINFIFKAGLSFLVSGVLILVDVIVGNSFWQGANLYESLKQIVGNFSAGYLSFGPRPHDISTGNILFNQVPDYAFVANYFTNNLWWIMIFAISFFLFVFIGWLKFLSYKNYYLLSVFTSGLFLAYLSRYFLNGENLFARRLDVVLAFMFIILFLQGIFWMLNIFKNKKSIILLLLIFGIFSNSIAMAASYTLGPDIRVIDNNEYLAIKYVWKENNFDPDTCVLSDTYPLLVLEALSDRQVIGGNFPIDEHFAQSERVNFYQEILDNPVEDNILGVLNFVQKDDCWFVFDKNDLSLENLAEDYIIEKTAFENIAVWKLKK